MPTPVGTITLADVQTEFGGVNPISLSEYYAGGGYVPSTTSGVPTSGTISMDDLRGKSAVNYGALTPSVSSIAEGASCTFTLSGGSGITNGTYYWRIEGTNITAADFTALSGSFTITSNTGSFTVASLSDGGVESTETFRGMIGIASGVPVAYVTSAYVSLTDTPVPTYSASWSPTSINEGGSSTVTLATTNVASGTTLWYNITGTASYLDLVGVAGANGTFTTTGNSTPSTFFAAYDALVESAETLTVSYRTASGTGGAVLASANLTINQSLGVVTSLVMSAVGGDLAGGSVTLKLQITSIAAYAADRTFDVTYNLDGGAFTNSGLAAATLTVAANATSSALTTIYGPLTAGSTIYTVQCKVTCVGHTDKTSNTLVGYI